MNWWNVTIACILGNFIKNESKCYITDLLIFVDHSFQIHECYLESVVFIYVKRTTENVFYSLAHFFDDVAVYFIVFFP